MIKIVELWNGRLEEEELVSLEDHSLNFSVNNGNSLNSFAYHHLQSLNFMRLVNIEHHP